MLTKYQLLAAFLDGKPLNINNDSILITSIEREDGGGKSFNVTGFKCAHGTDVYPDKITVYAKTID